MAEGRNAVMPNYARPSLNDDDRRALQKPRVGEYVLERKATKRKLTATEKKNKEKAKRRDKRECRAPHASQEEYDNCRRLRKEAAHLDHKKMGGDPTGLKSFPDRLITFSIRCHRERFDGQQPAGITLLVLPLTGAGTNGPVAFLEKQGDGRWDCTHLEREIGDANKKWRRNGR